MREFFFLDRGRVGGRKCGAATFSMMTLSITTLSITTVSIKGFFVPRINYMALDTVL